MIKILTNLTGSDLKAEQWTFVYLCFLCDLFFFAITTYNGKVSVCVRKNDSKKIKCNMKL